MERARTEPPEGTNKLLSPILRAGEPKIWFPVANVHNSKPLVATEYTLGPEDATEV